ncbi:MAG: nucleotidyltransferase family protein [Gemmatimonadetes bacterium]|nr:nucleotidyltransferase family protein [Gemmatimonadota bacterium]
MRLAALLLAAGRSTRIAPLAGDLPKPLLQLGGRSLLDWNLQWLAAHGIRSVWINLHYRAHAIRDALGYGERWGMRIRYSLEDSILGTAGGWKHLSDHWRGTSLVVYGDNLLRFDLRRFLSAHRSHAALASVALFDPQRHRNTGIAGGRAELAESGRICGFEEGGAGRSGAGELVNAGAYLLEKELAERVASGFQDFGRDVFPRLAPTGCLYGHVMEDEGFCLGVDTPERFAVAQRLIESGEVSLS